MEENKKLKDFERFFEYVLSGRHPLNGKKLSPDSIWSSPTIVNTMQDFLQSPNDDVVDDSKSDSACDFPF